MTGFDWVIAISVGIIAVAFAVLVVFLAISLSSVKKTIETTNMIARDLEKKIHAFDPYVRLISGIGQSLEGKTDSLREFSHSVRESYFSRSREKANIFNTSLEVAEWALIGLALWQKIRERK